MALGLLSHLLPHTVGGAALLLLALSAAYQLSIYIYNLFFHPLAHFPGSKLAAASCFPQINQALRGNVVNWIVELHLKYGEVVRVSPNQLSFSSADAWKDIYGHKKPGQGLLTKDPSFSSLP